MENGNAKRTTGVGSGTPHEHAASKPKPTREHKRHQITVDDGEVPNRRAATTGLNPHRHLKRKSATERKELLPKKTKRARKIAPTRSALPDSTESINDLPHALRNDPPKKITSPDQLANPTPEIWRKSSCRHQRPTASARLPKRQNPNRRSHSRHLARVPDAGNRPECMVDTDENQGKPAQISELLG